MSSLTPDFQRRVLREQLRANASTQPVDSMADKRVCVIGAGPSGTAALRAFKHLPTEARETLTVDNGKEFARHEQLAQTL